MILTSLLLQTFGPLANFCGTSSGIENPEFNLEGHGYTRSPSPPPVPLPPPPPQQPRNCCIRIPAQHVDMLPEVAPATVNEADEPRGLSLGTASSRRLPRVILIVRDTMKTALNPFHLWREYLHRPSYDPDSFLPVDDLANVHESERRVNSNTGGTGEPTTTSSLDPPWPFSNMSIWKLMRWLNSGSSMKSETEVNRLVNEVILQPDFSVDDLRGFNSQRENAKADNAAAPSSGTSFPGFTEVGVNIQVPSGRKDTPPGTFTVPGLYYRDILAVIKEAFAHPLSAKYHLSPFRLFHQPPSSDKEYRVHGEIYTSDAFIKEHDRVQRTTLHPDDIGCTRERAVAALMFWSDSTHLAQFGNAKLWPIYMMLGNLSKYIRSQPNSQACHHLAYIPSVKWLYIIHDPVC